MNQPKCWCAECQTTCVVKGCEEEADWIDLCQDHWEEYCSFTFWETQGGIVGPHPEVEDWLKSMEK